MCIRDRPLREELKCTWFLRKRARISQNLQINQQILICDLKFQVCCIFLLCCYCCCCYSEFTIDYQKTYQVVKWFGSLYGRNSIEPDFSGHGLEFLKTYKSINSCWYAISSFKCVAFPSSVAVAVIRNWLSTIKTLIKLSSDLVAFTWGTQVHLISQDTGSNFSKPTN